MTNEEKEKRFCHQCINCVHLDKTNPQITDVPFYCSRFRLDLGHRSVYEKMACVAYKRRKTNKIPRKVY